MNLGTVSAAVVVSSAGICSGAIGQSFPIRAVAEPIWPADMGMDPVYWDEHNGTMERVGDLNGDGVDDLLVLLAGYNTQDPEDQWMWVYWGSKDEAGNLSLGTPDRIDGFELGGYITDIVVQDQDGDGLDDLFIVTSERHSLEVWKSTGTGFVQGLSLNEGSGGQVDRQRVLIADLNQDGVDDYALYSDGDEIGTWMSQGDGTYLYEFLDVYFEGYGELVATDLEVDGDLDLMYVVYGEIIFVRRFEDEWSTRPSQDGFGIDLINFSIEDEYQQICADLNDDGLMDVVVWGEDDEGRAGLGFYLAPFGLEFEVGGPPNNPFYFLIDPEPREIESLDWSSLMYNYWHRYFSSDEHPSFIESVGDLDGDGTNDLVFTPFEFSQQGWRISDPMNQNGRHALYSEQFVHGEGMNEVHYEREPNSFVYRAAFIDLNGDGVKDRVVPSVAERFDYLFETNEEQLGLTAWGLLANPMKRDVVVDGQDAIAGLGSMSHVIASDLDADGDPEIIFNNGSHYVIDRDPSGLFRLDRDTRMVGRPSGFRTVIAQMDDDPTPDVLSLGLHESDIAPSCFLNPALSGFSGTTTRTDEAIREQELHQLLDEIGIDFVSHGNSFSTGDLDGDGTTDIVIRGRVHIDDGYEGESVLVWLNDGTGQFSLGPISPVGELRDDRIYNMELIDANLDGILDVVCVVDEVGRAGYAIETYLNDGSGGFVLDQSLWVELYFDMIPYWIVVEDVDGDGIDDVSVLITDFSAGRRHEVIIAYGGESGLEEQLHRWAGGNAAEIVLADLDGDGMKDLLSCSYQDDSTLFKNSVSVMFQGAAREFGPMVSIADVNLSGVNVADLDSDGGVDLIACSNGTNDQRVVRVYYGIDQVCPADMNFDGSHNYLDIALFLKLVGEGREAADLNRDGVFGFEDVNTFLDAFMNGCATAP